MNEGNQKIRVAATEYGYVDLERREYVITRPDTPTPWINYLGEGRYGGIISNTGGGYSFDRDPRHRRVTRYRYNGIPEDQPGRYVYLRDQDTGTYWSPTWQPVTDRALDEYECRHGTAYTQIASVYQGIRTQIQYFVPPIPPDDECPCELWVLTLKNESDRERHLRSFSYVEFSFYDALVDLTNLDWAMHVIHSQQNDGIITVDTHARPSTSFFASDTDPVGFDTDREVFVGRYHDLAAPRVVEMGEPQGSEAPRGNNIGSLCHEWTLAPGEEKQIVYMLGVTDNPVAIPDVVERYSDSHNVEAAFDALLADWDEYLSTFSVETPDPEMDAMLNFCNPWQCRANLYWSRFVSGYDTGMGRGMGTRDSAQDTLGTVHSLPDHARKVLSTLWKLQFKDGHTWHQVFPLTGEGAAGLAAEMPERPQWFSDDHLWLVSATCAYLRETGDLDYLEQPIAYEDGGEETVWEHMLRAVDFTLDHRGPHGLPRIGFSDWNDTLNLDRGSGKAESVWTAQQFCGAMLDLVELCEHIGKEAEAERFQALHDEMSETIDEYCWDGAWYTRAYDDDGEPLGVQGADHLEIALNTQTWAVLAELSDRERVEQAMESAHERLNTPVGLELLDPPFDGHQDWIGGLSTYPPGAKENGGIFCHANTWAVVAAAKLGWGDRAYRYYRQFLPLARTDLDRYMAEPYVYCQNICSPEHPQYGMGRNTWLTGTASWSYVAATQWILGIRPTFDGLRIEPVIPAEWSGFKATRVFRGVTYDVSVERTGSGEAISVSVDGVPVEGTVIPFPPEGREAVKVEVSVGG